LLLLTTAARPARAADVETKARCKASYESAQVLKRDEHLEAARTQTQICRETCPAPLASQCVTWETEIEALMPTVKIAARTDTGGAPLAMHEIRVWIDGRAITLSDKSVVAIDPGTHVFRFEAVNGQLTAAETKEEVHAGEREHLVSVVLQQQHPQQQAAPKAVTPEYSRKDPRTASILFGTSSIVLVGTAGVLAIKGHIDRSNLREDCAPLCSDQDVDKIRTLWWISAGFAAAGAVALAVAVVVWPRGASTSLKNNGSLLGPWRF